MPRFIQRNLMPNQVTGDISVTTSHDLPTNPISAILVHINPLNNIAAGTQYSFTANLLSLITSLVVTYRGAPIVSASGPDLAALAVLWHKRRIWQANASNDNNFRRSLVLPILFGRRPYMQNECLPATQPGDLAISITWGAVAGLDVDDVKFSVDTIELPGARPAGFQRISTINQTLTIAVNNDIDMPMGQILRSILLWGTTAYAGTSPLPTLGQLSLLVSGLSSKANMYYDDVDFEVLHDTHGLWGCDSMQSFTHIHAGNDLQPETAVQTLENYALMNLDVTGDDLYSLNTAEATRIVVRSLAGDSNPARAVPVELVAVRYLDSIAK